MDEVFIPIFVVLVLFIGLPWIIFHYITKWKSAATLTQADENLLDELHDVARRLDDRMVTIERILAAENPNWRSVGADPTRPNLEDARSGGLDQPTRSTQFGRRI
jgi:phage shock protein B